MIDLLKLSVKPKLDGLFLVVMGASGVGKSRFIGTYPGRTLLLYGSGESHGPASASVVSGDNLIAVPWDRNESGELQPDGILPRIKSILAPDVLAAAGIKCVALDSITNLCLDLKRTTVYKQRCADTKGNHNPFKETEALIELLTGVIRQLQQLNDYHKVDSICTMDLSIQKVSDEGYILESKPGLPSFGVGKAIIQQFADITVLNRRGNNSPQFENLAVVTSSSEDRATKETVKYLEFHPRLRGVAELPETLEATVPAIMKLKGVK